MGAADSLCWAVAPVPSLPRVLLQVLVRALVESALDHQDGDHGDERRDADQVRHEGVGVRRPVEQVAQQPHGAADRGDAREHDHADFGDTVRSLHIVPSIRGFSLR